MADPEGVGLFAVPGEGGLRAADFEPQTIFPAGSDLGDPEDATGAATESEKNRPAVFRVDFDGLGGSEFLFLGLKGLDLAFGAITQRVNGFKVGANGFDFEAGDGVGEIEPMRADVGNRAEFAAFFGEDAPIVIVTEEKPVLDVAPDNGENIAEVAAFDELAGFKAEGIKADVVVDGGGAPGFAGKLDQLCRLGGVHGQGFLAKHMLAGEEGARGHFVVKAVGGRDVDRLDRVVLKNFLETFVSAGKAQRGRGTSGFSGIDPENTAEGDPDAFECFDVNRPNETCANNCDSNLF